MTQPDTKLQQLIEEAGLLIEQLDDCFRSEANDSFHNYVGLVKQMTSIVEKHLSTIASKSAEEERKRVSNEVKKIENIYIDEFDSDRKISFGRHMAFEDCREGVLEILGEQWGFKAFEALSQKETND